jgi:hypothetical protein
VLLEGAPIASTFASGFTLTTTLPSGRRRESRVLNLTVVNAGPGGGSAAGICVVSGPYLESVSPTDIAVMTPASPSVLISATGQNLGTGDLILLNGSPFPTTFVNGSLLTTTVDGSFAATLQPGGFAVTIVSSNVSGSITSNALGITVGAPGFPDNLGAVTLAARPPTPGLAFDIRVEAPVANSPVTLLLDFASAGPALISIIPGFDVAVGVGFGLPFPLTDGLGLFGPPTPGATLQQWSPALGAPNVPRGLFEIRDLVAPPVVIGAVIALQAVYADLSSPIGLGVTHLNFPQIF